jgi:hypothetical protein
MQSWARGKQTEVEDDRWAPPVIGGKETGAYPFGFRPGGPLLDLGQNGSQGPFFNF